VPSLFPRYKAIVSFPILVMSFLLFAEGITPSFHRRDWRALLRRIRLLRLGLKRQKMQVLRVK